MAKKVEAKGKGFCGVKGLTEDALTAAAEDLNSSLGLNPPIDVDDLEGEELLEAVKVSFEEVYANDQLEDETWEVMTLLGIEAQPAPEETPAPAKKAAGKKGKAAPEPPEDDDEPAPKKGKKLAKAEPEDDDDVPAPKKGKKAAPPVDDDDDDVPAPKGKAKAETKKAAPATKKAPEGPKYSRSDAFGEALMAGKKNKKSLTQIIEDSDKLYSDATGRRSNTKEAAWCANLSLKALAACGYVTVDGDAIEILVRP